MTDEERKEFALRISQSNKTQIVVITYEIILNYIDSAKNCYEDNDVEMMIWNLKKAKQFINDLSSNLDFKYSISAELLNLYRYANKIIFNCIIKKNVDGINAVENIIENLRVGFDKVAKTDNRGAAINNSTRVYAGLTYGNNSKLNEVCYTFDKTSYLR